MEFILLNIPIEFILTDVQKMRKDLFEYNSTNFTYSCKEIITDTWKSHKSGTKAQKIYIRQHIGVH